MPRPADPNTHETVLKSARAEFARHGLTDARIEDIARAAGISKGAFYLHFESKEEAFDEILQRFMGVVEEFAARRRDAEEQFIRDNGPLKFDGSPEALDRFERLFTIQRASDVEFLEVLWRNRDILAAIESASGLKWREKIGAFHTRMKQQVIGDLRAKIALGRLRRDLDADALGDVVFGAYESFIKRMPALREKPDLETWTRTVSTALTQGILPSPGASKATTNRKAR